jgi:hypothetical protein
MDKGKYVSRSTYQKVVEENKKLKQDLKLITTLPMHHPARIAVHKRWSEHFTKQEQFNRDLRDILIHAVTGDIFPKS